MIKAAFFDVDGTLVSFENHRIPVSTVDVLRRMRDRGILLFLATGRALNGIPPVVQELLDAVPFAGLLTFNGQVCCDAEGAIYRDVPLDTHDVHAIVEQAFEGMYDILIMQRSRIFVSSHSERVLEVEREIGTTYEEADLVTAFDEPTYQICVYVDPGEEGVFMDRCRNVAHTRWCDSFCDIIPATGGKPAGIKATLERFGLTPAECIAFGDGGNDVPMFGCVGTSVALGNAGAEVKAAATYVTDAVDDDGILHACEHLGLA